MPFHEYYAAYFPDTKIMIWKLLLFFMLTKVLAWGFSQEIVQANVSVASKKAQSFHKLILKLPTDKVNGFVIAQVHSQLKPNTLAYTDNPSYDEKITGMNNGLLKILNLREKYVTFYEQTYQNETLLNQGVVSVLESPVPGACCQTCVIEIDPNIYITYDLFKTYIHFYRASKYFSKNEIPECDNKEYPSTYTLTYDVYYFYLPQNDLSRSSLFDAIKKMSTPQSVKENGKFLTRLTGPDELSLTVETVFGQGVVFSVIVHDNEYSTAYTPSATYGCNLTSTSNECSQRGSTVSLVYCVLFAIIGLILCFAGFKLYKVLLFTCGTLFFWLIIYSLMAKSIDKTNIDDLLIISSMCSLIGGGFFLFLYGFKKFIYICLLNVCLVFGLLVAAIVFYTPFGYFDIWNRSYHFALGFTCITLAVSVVFLFFPKTVCYLCSSLWGSYGIILLPNYFLRGNMQYIVLTVVLRLTVQDFGSSYLRRPYMKNEYILTGVWGFLFLFGFILQFFTTRKENFEVSGKKLLQKTWAKFTESTRIGRKKRSKHEPRFTERSSLITNEKPLAQNYTLPPPESGMASAQPTDSYWVYDSSRGLTTFRPTRTSTNEEKPPSHSVQVHPKSSPVPSAPPLVTNNGAGVI